MTGYRPVLMRWVYLVEAGTHEDGTVISAHSSEANARSAAWKTAHKTRPDNEASYQWIVVSSYEVDGDVGEGLFILKRDRDTGKWMERKEGLQ